MAREIPAGEKLEPDLKEGDKVRIYEIIQYVSGTAYTANYEAKRDTDGAQVFVKLFRAPNPTDEWFFDFITHQKDLIERIQTTAAKDYVIPIVDEFTISKKYHNYFHVTRFEPHSDNLAEALLGNPPPTWDQRQIWAKVLMHGLHELHAADIVYSDLKPANILAVKEPSARVGHKIRFIDLDTAFFSTRLPPWHGRHGYSATDKYRAPECYDRDAVPTSAADVFQAGLVLYELLGHGHPHAAFFSKNEKTLLERIMCGEPEPLELRGRLHGNEDRVISVIQSMLSPDPQTRPSAEAVHQILCGQRGAARPTPAEHKSARAADTAASDAAAAASVAPVITDVALDPAPATSETVANARVAAAPSPVKKEPSPPEKQPRAATDDGRPKPGELALCGAENRRKIFRMSFELCRPIVGSLLGIDGSGWDRRHQANLKREGKLWFIEHNPTAKDMTCVNGMPVSTRQRLVHGDEIRVVSREKSKSSAIVRVELE